MTINKSKKKSITPSRRRTLAINRIITNVRQLVLLDPTDEIIALIEQHTTLLNAMYRHHAAMTAKESSSLQSNDTSIDTSIDTPLPNEHVEIQVEKPDDPEQTASSVSTPVEEPELCDLHVKRSVVRLPRKLKKQLKSLPDNHPLRRRYASILAEYCP